MNKLNDICPDFSEWPKRWMVIEKDFDYGNQLLEEMGPFANFLAESGLAKKTIERHLSNLWLLGGEIIRDVSFDNEYSPLPPKNSGNRLGRMGALIADTWIVKRK